LTKDTKDHFIRLIKQFIYEDRDSVLIEDSLLGNTDDEVVKDT